MFHNVDTITVRHELNQEHYCIPKGHDEILSRVRLWSSRVPLRFGLSNTVAVSLETCISGIDGGMTITTDDGCEKILKRVDTDAEGRIVKAWDAEEIMRWKNYEAMVKQFGLVIGDFGTVILR